MVDVGSGRCCPGDFWRRRRGEASGVYYKSDKTASILKQIEALRSQIEAGISRDALQKLLPPGGGRNALDCALWDLEAKVSGRPAWADGAPSHCRNAAQAGLDV
jgi:hypothetical protein